jgi:uncharacterized membrane-anchored protein YitT (DUF2179 family)
MNYFIIANGLAEGGLTGITLILHYLMGWPVGLVLFILNIPLFFLGWKSWGKLFVFKTLIGVLAVSLAIELTKGFSLHTTDTLLAALYGGAFSGVVFGLVLRSGGTTGGVDILARYISERQGISMGKIYFTCDFLVMVFFALFFGIDKALYTLVAVMTFSVVVDRIIEGLDEAKAVTIISDSTPIISTAIINELDRGVTLLDGTGGFTGNKKQVLYVVVGRHQLLRLKSIVKDADPQAFVIVNNVHEVLGEGFHGRI